MAVINGTDGDDVIRGGTPSGDTSGDDTINTFGGNDVISTAGGFDIVNAGSGDDQLTSGGNQGYNADLGDGNDRFYGYTSINSTMNMGAGDDWVFFKAADGVVNTLTLGSGKDTVELRYGGSYIFTDFGAGPGGDSLQFLEWFMNFGTAMDWWFDMRNLGPSGVPNPFGTGRAQLIDSATGALLQVRPTVTSMWTTLATFQGLTVSQFNADNFLGWSPDGASAPGATLNVVESRVQFDSIDTYGDDIIYGTSAGGYIHYTGGADIIYGGDGNDEITGTNYFASGFKTIYGGGGDDTIGLAGFEGYDRGPYNAPVRDTVWGLAYGGDGNDSIGGGWSADELHGDAGNDFINGGGGDDVVDGGDGDDRLIGSVGNDTLTGGAGNDSISGGTENDNLDGGADNDSLDGAAGSDILRGGSGIDSLLGGAGADTFRDSAANLNGDTISDFTVEDKIVITDATLAGFSFSISGNILSYTGGSVTLTVIPTGTITATAAIGGGVQLAIAATIPHVPHTDINGDTRSDIVLRSTSSGWLTDWLGTATGSLSNNGSNTSILFPVDWRVSGTGDFNGDGLGDVLLRNDAGWLTNWLGGANGGLANNGANASLFFSPDWKVAGTGDFNGDGRGDILLRSDAGWITNWLGTQTGGFSNNGANVSLFFTADWKIVSTGDFNGDGLTDIMLRRDDGWLTDWLGTTNGGFTNNGANTALYFTTDWKVVGTGDINGDGRDDLVLRRDDGWITDWLGTATGSFTNNGSNTALYLTTDWTISSIGDFNGDGREDILLRHGSGWMTDWLGTATGSFTNNGGNFSAFIAPDWQVQEAFL